MPFVAYGQSALFYSRAKVDIQRKQATPSLPWQSAGDAASAANVTFDMEVRDAKTLYRQEGWFNLSSPSPQNGVMFIFNAPTVFPIIHTTDYAPLDILFVSKEGIITQIVPNVALSELKEDIYPNMPILAMLFLAGGICERVGIKPGDWVDYPGFEKPPQILGAPSVAPQTPPVIINTPPEPLIKVLHDSQPSKNGNGNGTGTSRKNSKNP
ncbi:MAG: DUF192 domain-containing protein [Rickettsiales bacterium]|nr:DUF192 domain-containing protein [Rickettsiales bacterium]